MADNYLEKHYDDYERRKAEWERKKRLGLLRKKRPATDSKLAEEIDKKQIITNGSK